MRGRGAVGMSVGAIAAGTLLAGVSVVGVSVAPVAAGVSADWKQIAVGGQQSCGLTTDGQLFCWGDDEGGALGDGVIANPLENPAPVGVVGGGTNWKQVSVGGGATCAVKTSGRLFCWGVDDEGALGDGTAA